MVDNCIFLRRRRCFEIAKPRRSAGGAQLNRSLGELEGPIRDPVLARFPKVAAFSSAESGSDEPPDRAQICAMLLLVVCRVKLFFSEPILGPPEWYFGRGNAKKSVKKVDSIRHVATNCAKPGSGSKSGQKVDRTVIGLRTETISSAFAGGATCPAGSFYMW